MRGASASGMAADLPTLPPIDGHMLLAVFTPKSWSDTSHDEFGDSERLCAIGKRVLAMTVAFALFQKRPMLSAADLEVRAI